MKTLRKKVTKIIDHGYRVRETTLTLNEDSLDLSLGRLFLVTKTDRIEIDSDNMKQGFLRGLIRTYQGEELRVLLCNISQYGVSNE